MTAAFGVAMVIIGSTVVIEGRGARLLVELADRLQQPMGRPGRWVFLVGAFGAVFSSLLGVWQAVPYLFADTWRLFVRPRAAVGNGEAVDTRCLPYRAYLVAIATVPTLGLLVSFKEVQKVYAVIGAAFIPILALVLLVLNGRRSWVCDFVNRWPTAIALIGALAFFAGMAWARWV